MTGQWGSLDMKSDLTKIFSSLIRALEKDCPLEESYLGWKWLSPCYLGLCLAQFFPGGCSEKSWYQLLLSCMVIGWNLLCKVCDLDLKAQADSEGNNNHRFLANHTSCCWAVNPFLQGQLCIYHKNWKKASCSSLSLKVITVAKDHRKLNIY